MAHPSIRPASSRHRGTVALLGTEGVCVAEVRLCPGGLTLRRSVSVANDGQAAGYDASQPASAAAALAQVIQTHGFSRRLLAVALPSELFGAMLADLPPVEGRALRALVTRRVRDETVSRRGDLLADFFLLDALDGQPAQRALVTWGDARQMREYHEGFLRHELQVDRVVPPGVALIDLFTRTREAHGEQIELCVHLQGPAVLIAVTRGRTLLYVRFLNDLLGDADGNRAAVCLPEIQRTITFVRERRRGQATSAVWLAGFSDDDSAWLDARLQEQTGLGARPLAVEVSVERRRPDEGTLLVLASLAVHVAERRRAALDLLPPREQSPRRLLQVLSTVGALVLGVGVFNFVEAEEKQAFAKESIRRLEEDLARLDARATWRETALDHPEVERAWAEIFAPVGVQGENPVLPALEAALHLPDAMQLAAVSLENTLAGSGTARTLRLELLADLTGAGAGRLREFLDTLRGMPWCEGLHSTNAGFSANAESGRPVAEEVVVECQLR